MAGESIASFLRSCAVGKACGAAVAAALVLAWTLSAASAQTPEAQYRKLPAQVRQYVEGVRKDCVDLNPQSKPYDIMQGIAAVELGGAPALFVDAETLCNARMAGANCTNHDCDLKIWRRVGAQTWRKVFDEHLFRKFISVNDKNRFSLMAVTVYAGNPHCQPTPGKTYTSGQSCDALVRYRDGRWVWQKIR
jgi:hypothetical protein